ncbi:MAG: hypothetical protein KKF21_11910, partial [Bacteroidetes bacterium]|nr:hypothetical protein [Bacteroidota bacterium]
MFTSILNTYSNYSKFIKIFFVNSIKPQIGNSKFYSIKLFTMLLFFSSFNFAQDSNFVLTTNKTETYFPTYIGNGHFSISSSQLGTLPTESYMIKFYDHAKNDIPRIAALPEWNEINYFNGEKWLNDIDFMSEEITNYSQSLDMFNGILTTCYDWETSTFAKSHIEITTFVSRSNKNLAIKKIEITPYFINDVKISFPLKERERPKRSELEVITRVENTLPGELPSFWYPGFTEIVELNVDKNNFGGRIKAQIQSEGRNTQAEIASDIYCNDLPKEAKIEVSKTSKSTSINYTLKTEKGKKYTFYDIISVVPQIDKNEFGYSVNQIIEKSKELGFDSLLSAHKAEWNNLWKTDIVIEGNSDLQLIVRSMIFYLLCSADKNTEFGIPPMGLSTSGYFGHIFWDSDIYMMPALLIMHPKIAKSLVVFRSHTLESAVKNADKNNYKGAMYPWESDEIGAETTPFFAYQNALKENHIVGDVAFAQWQYFSATKDTAYMRESGAEIIRKTADFWVSRATFNEQKDRYEINDIISVSESDRAINNETYTNAIAKINLGLAIKVSNLFNLTKNPDWQKIYNKLYIPYDVQNDFHPSFEGEIANKNINVFWSSVVNLLCYPLQMEMNESTKRNDLSRAVKSLEKNGAGAMMGSNFLSIIAAELGDKSLLNFTIDKTLKGYLKPPFNVLSETHENKSVNFLTGAGSFLQQVIFGYTGLRITDDGIVQKYKPLLPDGVKKLILKNFTINNLQYNVVVSGNKIEKIKIK